MSAQRRGRLGAAAVIVLSVAFALLAHATLVDAVSPAVGAALSLMPLALLAAWALRRAGHRILGLACVGIVAAGLWLGWEHLERHFPNLFFVQHAGANLLLGGLFGRTLAGGREPLCTRFARMLHDHLPPEVERYTRQVTIAWTVFFASLFALSCGLYFGGYLSAWSVLANFASPLLIVAMFVAEYAVRHRVLPDWERVGLLGGLKAFSRHFEAQRAQAR